MDVRLRALRFGATAFSGLPALTENEREVRLREGYGVQPSRKQSRRLVTLNFASWNQLAGWLREIEGLRAAA